jgi:hypothetical protein
LSTRGLAGERVRSPAARSAFCYQRGEKAWIEYAVNREHVGVPIEAVDADEKGLVTFTLAVEGERRAFVLDTATSTWKQ